MTVTTNSEKKQAKKNITRSTLAVFFNFGTKRSLRPCDVVDLIKEDYQAVYSAIRRFSKKGILKKVKKKTNKTYYQLKNKEAALEYLDSEVAIIGGIPRSLSKVLGGWLDFDRAFLEWVGPVNFSVLGYVTNNIREFLLSQGSKTSKGDRAKQLSHSCKSFSLKISVYGKIGFWIKNPDWIVDFNRFLIDCGLDDTERGLVFMRIVESIKDSNVSVEMPVLSNDVPRNTTIKTKVGDFSLISRITSSHFPRELEIQGNFGPIQNFLAILAGSQHFSMLELLQADRLDKILHTLQIMIKHYDRTARALESLSKEAVRSKPQEEEVETKREKVRYIT